MEKHELSNEKFEELTKGKKPFFTISYYEVEGKEEAVASVHSEEDFLAPFMKDVLQSTIIQLGALLAKIRWDFLKEKERKEEADSVKC